MDANDLKLFLTVALPIMLSIFVGVWSAVTTNNKRLDDVNKRIDELTKRFEDFRNEMNRRFDRIEDLLRNHEDRLTRPEERTSFVRVPS